MSIVVEISDNLPDENEITDIYLVEQMPSPNTLCKTYTAKELSRMCLERGLRGTAKNKMQYAMRLHSPPP